MKCYACDTPVSGDDLDKPTGRYYCSECFEPTIQEMMKLAEGNPRWAHVGTTLEESEDALAIAFEEASDEEEQELAEKIFYGEGVYDAFNRT